MWHIKGWWRDGSREDINSNGSQWSEWSKWEGVGWIAEWNESISRFARKNRMVGNWTAPRPLLKRDKNMEKIKFATTSFRDNALFKPNVFASTAPKGGSKSSACNEHRQNSKSWRLWLPGLNYEILMFHWFTVTISRSNPPMHCASMTRTAAIMREQNIVEPCWTLPLRNTILIASKDLVQTLHLPHQCRQTLEKPRIPPPADWKKMLEGFEGIAFRVSMFQHMQCKDLTFHDDHALHQCLPPFLKY